MKMFARAALLSVMVGVSGAAFSADADMEKLLKDKGCLACHKADAKLVGPSYKEVAAKYKNDKTAEAKLAEKVIKGGVGVWGQVPMPPNTTVKPEEAKALVKYVLTIK